MQWVLLHTVHLVPLLGLGGWFAWTYVLLVTARRRGGRQPDRPVEGFVRLSQRAGHRH